MDRRGWRFVVAGVVSVAVAAGAAFVLLGDRTQDAAAEQVTTQPVERDLGPVTVAVDATLTPEVAEVTGVDEGDPPRPVGVVALAGEGGGPTEVVRNELVVLTEPADVLDDWLTRWQATTVAVDSEDGGVDTLVRIDPDGLSPFADLGDRLDAVEDGFEAPVTVSDEDLAVLLSAYADAHALGLDPTFTGPSIAAGIETLTAREAAEYYTRTEDDEPWVTADGYDDDPFTWDAIATGAPNAYGVDAVWRLAVGRGLTQNRIPVLVVDSGFFPGVDWPSDTELVEGELSEENPGECSGGAKCPAHGSLVLESAAAGFDDGYGTVGTGWPVVAPRIYHYGKIDEYTRARRIKRLVRDHDIRVVNMSFGWTTLIAPKAAERALDRHFSAAVDDGALLIGSAGNDSTHLDGLGDPALTAPCEVPSVLCIGGMAARKLSVHPGSNFGSEGGRRSVELHAPYCLPGRIEPMMGFSTTPDAIGPVGSLRTICGTSYSAPYVAGIAATLIAADPSLTPEQVRALLLETARVFEGRLGGDALVVSPDVALREVLGARAGVVIELVEAPGPEYAVGEFVPMRADATDEAGYPIDVEWSSDRDGVIAVQPAGQRITPGSLSPGTHTLTARGLAPFGPEPTLEVQLTIVDQVAETWITYPSDGDTFHELQGLVFVGDSEDPDTYEPAPDGAVRWAILRDGQTVESAFGHTLELPGGVLPPGAYEARFGLADLTADAVITFTITAIPAGESPPEVSVTSPDDGSTVVVSSQKDGVVALTGSARDVVDGQLVQLSGDHLRWVATSGSERIEVCRGSRWPPPGGGGGGFQVVQPQDCSEAEVELYPVGDADTMWTITLWARDASGLESAASVVVTVRVVTG